MVLGVFAARPQKGPHSEKLLVETEHVDRQVQPVLNLPALAFKKRSDVEAILGKPIGYRRRADKGEIGDEADYPWGMVAYNSSRLVFVILRFPAKPANYQEAFAMLHLPEPSVPFRRNDDTLIWAERPYRTGFSCCNGLTIHDIFIDGTMSEIHVLLLDLDDPASWSESERQMWKKQIGHHFR